MREHRELLALRVDGERGAHVAQVHVKALRAQGLCGEVVPCLAQLHHRRAVVQALDDQRHGHACRARHLQLKPPPRATQHAPAVAA